MPCNKFDTVFELILKHEGGYVNDPNDPGGETKYGISKRSFPTLDIKNLTKQEAKEIYYKMWKKYKLDLLPYPLSAILFDIGINIGPRRAIRILQLSLNDFNLKTTPDGIIGPKTSSLCQKAPQTALAATFLMKVIGYYISLNKPRYLKGWYNRVKDNWYFFLQNLKVSFDLKIGYEIKYEIGGHL